MHCWAHNQQCVVPLRVHLGVSGLPCTDMSRAGKMLKSAGPTASVYLTHAKYCQNARVPLPVLECTPAAGLQGSAAEDCAMLDVRARTYMHIHTYIHTYIHTDLHTSMHACRHTYKQTYIHTFVYTHAHQALGSGTKALHGQSENRALPRYEANSGDKQKKQTYRLHPSCRCQPEVGSRKTMPRITGPKFQARNSRRIK